MGTLGVIVEASFKLAPAPHAEEHIQAEFASLTDACNVASELSRRGLGLWQVKMSRPMSLTDLGASPFGFFWLTVHLAGSTAAVERSRTEMAELVSSAGGTLDVTRIPTRQEPLPAWTNAGDPLTCQTSVLPTLLPALIEGVDREVPGAFLEMSPLAGSVSMTWLGAGSDGERVRRLRAITSGLGASLIVTGCDIELKRRIDVFGDPPPAFDLMRRVKQQFDPNGILSPGRFVGGL
jgi:glycolate oxidase FAD binding subunit